MSKTAREVIAEFFGLDDIQDPGSTADNVLDALNAAGLVIVPKDAEIDRLRAALDTIAKMRPKAIAGTFIHGPEYLLSNCRKVALAALAKAEPSA